MAGTYIAKPDVGKIEKQQPEVVQIVETDAKQPDKFEQMLLKNPALMTFKQQFALEVE